MVNHILLVDDDALLRRSLAYSLEQAGYHVSTEATAEDALALAQRHRPDLVILDIGLPWMDGRTALQQFREHAGSRSSDRAGEYRRAGRTAIEIW